MEKNLEKIHKLVCKSGFYLVTMLTKKSVYRSYLQASIENLEAALSELRLLQEKIDERTDSPRV